MAAGTALQRITQMGLFLIRKIRVIRCKKFKQIQPPLHGGVCRLFFCTTYTLKLTGFTSITPRLQSYELIIF